MRNYEKIQTGGKHRVGFKISESRKNRPKHKLM